jgi:hypothetical protein
MAMTPLEREGLGEGEEQGLIILTEEEVRREGEEGVITISGPV